MFFVFLNFPYLLRASYSFLLTLSLYVSSSSLPSLWQTFVYFYRNVITFSLVFYFLVPVSVVIFSPGSDPCLFPLFFILLYFIFDPSLFLTPAWCTHYDYRNSPNKYKSNSYYLVPCVMGFTFTSREGGCVWRLMLMLF